VSEGQAENPAVTSAPVGAQKSSVEIFLNSLEKCIRSARVYRYESGQKMMENIYENVIQAIDRAFFEEEVIDVHVKPYQMMFQGRVVYENKEKKSSLSWLLYEHGVRMLSFKRGMARDELIGIIGMLATDFNVPEMMDHDLYCVFIENRLDHFEVIGFDKIGELQKESPDLKEELGRFRKLIGNRSAPREAPQTRKLRQDDLKVIEEFQLSPAQFAKPDEEVNKIVQSITAGQLGTKREKETLERLALMGFHFLLQERDVDQNQVGRDLVSQVAIMMLEEEYIPLFGALVKKIQQLHRDMPNQRGEYQKILDAIFSVDRESLIRRLFEKKDHQTKLAEILLSAPPSAVSLIVLLLDAQSWCPKVFSEFILKHLPSHSKWLFDTVELAPELSCWEGLINIFAARPTQKFAKFLTSLMQSAGSTLKVKVLRQCAIIGSEEALQVFRPLLTSSKYEDRKLAYDILPLAKNKAALLILKDRIDSKEFQSTSNDEKMEAYASLLASAGEAALIWLEAQWMQPGEGIFKGRHQNERRLLLLKAVAKTNQDFIESLLKLTPSDTLSKELQELLDKISKPSGAPTS